MFVTQAEIFGEASTSYVSRDIKYFGVTTQALPACPCSARGMDMLQILSLPQFTLLFGVQRKEGSLRVGKRLASIQNKGTGDGEHQIAVGTSTMGQMLLVSKIHRSRENDGATLTHFMFQYGFRNSPVIVEGYDGTSTKLPQLLPLSSFLFIS